MHIFLGGGGFFLYGGGREYFFLFKDILIFYGYLSFFLT